jgi:ABC-type uncharacterized transport system fused permease/ATPase subunit
MFSRGEVAVWRTMSNKPSHAVDKRELVLHFWRSARGFWIQGRVWRVWMLMVLLLAIVAAELLTQYLLNYWNRDFFDALEQKNSALLSREILLLFPLVALSTALSILSVWGRMTTQRLWRLYLTRQLVKRWMYRGRYRRLRSVSSANQPENPEFRITEDVRLATDAPIDLSLSLLSSVVTVVVFFDILARVGGALDIKIGAAHVVIPAYLGVGVVAYAGLITVTMLYVGRRWSDVVQEQLQAEASFRASANLIRESGEGLVGPQSERQQRHALWLSLHDVIERWRQLCGQHMRTTLVSQANSLLAPVVGLLLCVPKYIEGAMSLGEVTQAAAAFVTVQTGLSWLVWNFQRMADWRSSAMRVGTLLVALDELKQSERVDA